MPSCPRPAIFALAYDQARRVYHIYPANDEARHVPAAISSPPQHEGNSQEDGVLDSLRAVMAAEGRDPQGRGAQDEMDPRARRVEFARLRMERCEQNRLRWERIARRESVIELLLLMYFCIAAIAIIFCATGLALVSHGPLSAVLLGLTLTAVFTLVGRCARTYLQK